MIIIPAIDLLGGQCVRLVKGEYGSAEKVATDPIETALAFKWSGAQMMHIVDLDGAKEGYPVNFDIIRRIVDATGIPVEVGGGIRDMNAVADCFECGVSRVILGSAAYRDPALVSDSVREYGNRIAVGIDARGGMVSISGWCEQTDTDFIDFAHMIEQCGVDNIIFTDIDRDGTMTGVNAVQLKQLSEKVSCKITASGGLSRISEIHMLSRMGLYGAIIGKALYNGTIALGDAVLAGSEHI